MLAKRYRLPLQHIQRGSPQFRSPAFAVRTLVSKLPYARFAVVVGTSVDKRATARNRMRRLAFEVCATLQKRSSHDMVIIIQRPAALLPAEEFRKTLTNTITPLL